MSRFERKLAFVTLLADDNYYDGVSVLVKTLRKHNPDRRIKVVCLMDETRVHATTMKALEGICDEVLPVHPLVHKATGTTIAKHEAKATWESAEMTKLHTWNLTSYDQICYIDADCMVVGLLEDLFKDCAGVDFAAAPDVFPPDRFNAGVLVVKPSAKTFAHLCEALDTIQSYDGGDTGFLNNFFSDWYAGPSPSRLPYAYNCQRILYWFTYKKRPGYWDSIINKKVIHFSSAPKPWDETLLTAKGDLELQWWQALME